MTNQELEARNFLQDNGFTVNAIEGIMINLKHESGLNSRIIQGGAVADEPPAGLKGGYGLAQWTGVRLDELVIYARSKGTITGDFMTQLQFLVYEAKTSYPNAVEGVNAANTPIVAANIWAKEYERTAYRYHL